MTFIALNNKAFQAALISRNMMQVENLVKQVLKDEILDLVIILQIKKLSKVAVKVITNKVIQFIINKKLILSTMGRG